MLAPSIIAVGFSVYEAHHYETFYGPAQGALVEFQFHRKFRNGRMRSFLNGKERVALRHSDTAADGISFKLLREFTVECTKTLSELFYTFITYVFS